MAASVPIGKTIYCGTFAHCRSLSELDICAKGAIGVDEAGVIAFIEREVEEIEDVIKKYDGWNDAEVLQSGESGFFFPGFIDTHTHASQHPNTGLFGKTTLLSWLETYTFPMESSLSSLSKAATVYSNFVSRTLSHGTTTCAYYATIHVPTTNLLADICLKRGQRALVGRVCMNMMSPEYYRDASVSDAVKDSKASIDYIRSIDPSGDIVKPIITPRFAPSCTAECLAGLGQLAKETGTSIQTHISENKPEVQLVRELFPESKSYTDVYDTAGLLTPKTILAHAVHLSAEEVQTLKQSGTKISHCPASNTALTSGCAPVRQLLDVGLTVGLGTDVSGGFSPSILEECRQAIWVSRFVAMNTADDAKLSTEEVLYLATRGGAQVVGLDGKVGGFDVGMEWDAQHICLGAVKEGGEQEGRFAGNVDLFGFETAEDRVNKWVYSGDDRNTKSVWVRGRLVHRR
ncbi:guanine deaminase [Lindgomyces ingoldianus]|uniref:Guanine deaminase n=1 Tax=Lindgomyces ingoldianus TaxID=673940 RepID=A0ACB6R3F8_9PLEO|nr:guanine deaminase [Lindgomyces ingoldianus]KAF2473320.1 guanine deaminase [Lindgomyces ingoldianus]